MHQEDAAPAQQAARQTHKPLQTAKETSPPLGPTEAAGLVLRSPLLLLHLLLPLLLLRLPWLQMGWRKAEKQVRSGR